MSLREHIAEHFWSYTIVGGLLGWAAVKGEQYAKDDQYAADAYDMNLHVWLCGRCHHVFDEKEEADECCLDEVDETAESVQAEMFIESDGLAVAVEGLDGTYLTDGEIKMGYTSASEAGFEPKELKTVMWVWDDIEGYGAYLATEQITFLSESFGAESKERTFLITPIFDWPDDIHTEDSLARMPFTITLDEEDTIRLAGSTDYGELQDLLFDYMVSYDESGWFGAGNPEPRWDFQEVMPDGTLMDSHFEAESFGAEGVERTFLISVREYDEPVWLITLKEDNDPEYEPMTDEEWMEATQSLPKNFTFKIPIYVSSSAPEWRVISDEVIDRIADETDNGDGGWFPLYYSIHEKLDDGSIVEIDMSSRFRFGAETFAADQECEGCGISGLMLDADGECRRCWEKRQTFGAESFHADPLLDYIKQRERERNAGTVKLQGMGRMKGTKAEDVRVGDVLLWNQGGSSQVLSITPKGKKSLLWKTRTADNREWERTVRKNRLVVVARPNSYTAKKYQAESYVRRDERHLRPYQRSGLAFGGIVACKQENCPHGHCPRCGNCDDVLDNDGDGSEDDDNPMFCGACGESFSAESFASVVLAPEETTSPMRQALMTNYLIRKSMMEEELRYLQQEVLNGRMSRKQMAYRLMELEHRLRAEEDPKKRHKVKYLSGVKVKPRKLNGDLPPEVAMKRTLIGRESPETIKVEWDSNTQPIGSDPFNEVEWGAEQIEKGRRHRVGGQIVEECVDIQGGKVDETSNYYRVRFRDPKDFTNFRVPAWAARAANSIGAKYYDVRGSKITMGQTKEGGWKIQSVMVPNNSFVNPKEAAIIANHIQDRIEREGKWAKKECKDNERVLVVL